MNFRYGAMRPGCWGLGFDSVKGPSGADVSVIALHWFATIQWAGEYKLSDFGFDACTIIYDGSVPWKWGIQVQFWHWGHDFNFGTRPGRQR
jgi:hypothetical protein